MHAALVEGNAGRDCGLADAAFAERQSKWRAEFGPGNLLERNFWRDRRSFTRGQRFALENVSAKATERQSKWRAEFGPGNLLERNFWRDRRSFTRGQRFALEN